MQDRFTVRLVVLFEGAIVLMTLGLGVVLLLRGIDVPGEMYGIGTTALGSLGTLLVTTHSSAPEPPEAPPQPLPLRPGQQAVNQPKGA